MSRDSRVAIGILALLLILTALASRVDGRASARCWWEGSVLRADGLPTRDEVSVLVLPGGVPPFPVGGGAVYAAGSLAVDRSDLHGDVTAWLERRGGGVSLWDFGRGARDYKVIATCSTYLATGGAGGRM